MESWVREISEQEFADQVIEASRRQPVLVDFWAAWCSPCRALGPVLERLAEEYRGSFVLAKINTEEAPNLSAQFRIQSIPYVALFKEGRPVDDFVGLLPEEEIRRFLDRHIPKETDHLVEEARRLLEEGRTESARELLERVLKDSDSDSGALLGMAEIAFREGKLMEMEELLHRIPPLSPHEEEVSRLKSKAFFKKACLEAGGAEGAQARHEKSPGDLEARYQLALCLADDGKFRRALEILIEIVSADRNFREDGARKAMLEVFNVVGVRSPLADEFRSRLSRLIF